MVYDQDATDGSNTLRHQFEFFINLKAVMMAGEGSRRWPEHEHGQSVGLSVLRHRYPYSGCEGSEHDASPSGLAGGQECAEAF